MAELSLEERLQPSLLDRLTDDEPKNTVEARAHRVISINRLKSCVLRDLAWLLNCGSLSITEDLEKYPEVQRSVLNYGSAQLSGKSVAAAEISSLERRLRKVILDFEPRIIPETLKVIVDADREKMNNQALTFRIEGQLWAQPLPVNLYLSTDIDLETGGATVTETNG